MVDRVEEPRLVSVVIPLCERPEYLRGAIKTAVKQTYDAIEVIVVDDGSTEQYADTIVTDFPEHVQYVRHEENSGLSAARNTGIERATGRYVAFLDDGDRWHRGKIEQQLKLLERNGTVRLNSSV